MLDIKEKFVKEIISVSQKKCYLFGSGKDEITYSL